MFFFPFSDDNPATNRPFICYILIAISCFVFLWQTTLPTDLNNNAIYNFGVVPASLLGEKETYIPSFLTIFSSMFMHGGWMHLIGNMVFLWIFGDNVEDSMGRGKFICFYLLSGLAAALLQAIIDPLSEIPMIGASGAIAGVLGAYLILYPRANVNVLFWLFIFITVIRVPAFIVLGFWIVSQFFSASFAGDGGGVAYFAHIGGFVAGALLIVFFKDSQIKLFKQPQTKAFKAVDFDINDFLGTNKEKSFMDDFIEDAENKKRD